MNHDRHERALCLPAPRLCSWQEGGRREMGGLLGCPRWRWIPGRGVRWPASPLRSAGGVLSAARGPGERRGPPPARAGALETACATDRRALRGSRCPPWRVPATGHAPHTLNGHRPDPAPEATPRPRPWAASSWKTLWRAGSEVSAPWMGGGPSGGCAFGRPPPPTPPCGRDSVGPGAARAEFTPRRRAGSSAPTPPVRAAPAPCCRESPASGPAGLADPRLPPA